MCDGRGAHTFDHAVYNDQIIVQSMLTCCSTAPDTFIITQNRLIMHFQETAVESFSYRLRRSNHSQRIG